MINIDDYKILFDKYYRDFFIEILNNNIFEEEIKKNNNNNKKEYFKLIEDVIFNIFKKL